MILGDGVEIADNYSFFVKPNLYDITNKQLKEKEEVSELLNWGRRNPVLFAEEMYGIELMDYQKYVFMMSWNTPNVVWCMSRNSGKTMLGSIFIMTKTLLIPNHKSYILCGVGSQSVEMFTKIEQFVNNQNPSFTTLTDFYKGELQKSAANKTGFVHNPASYKYSLYNDSQVFTLNGSYNNNRSKRSNLNFYDECMNSPDELFATSEPFCTQNSKFAMGKGYTAEDMLMKPEPFANQLLYASSAGRTDQYFFKKYRECSLHMDAGDKRYFCADVSCDVVLTATKRGVGLPVALLTQDKIDSAMRKDKEAAMREYKNIFTSEGSDKQIISRASIIKNSFPYLPVLKNEDGSYFGIAYDPARRHDNSAIVIAKYWEDPIVGWKMRIVNCITLMDILKKKKMPINTPSQIKELKRLIVDYNGEKCADYENILHIGVDSGSGGAGVPITDFLCEDFELDGITHRGLIDPEFNEGDDRKYPNAVKDKLELISPTKHKTEMFEATIKMMDCNLIEFPEEYLNKGYITLLYKVDKNGNKTQVLHYPSEKEYEKLEKDGCTIEQEIVHLDQQQELALNQID